MGLFDKLRDKQEQKAIKENDQKKELAAKNRESVNDTVEKLENVLNNLGYTSQDNQLYISRLIKGTVKELRYSQTVASYDISDGDKMLGTVADQLAKALKKKDQSACTTAVKIIQKAVSIRREIQPYSEYNAEKMIVDYLRMLEAGQEIMDYHDNLYETDVIIKATYKEKEKLEKECTETKERVRTLRDSNDEAADFVEKFNPHGTQKPNECEGAQELIDALDAYKRAVKALRSNEGKLSTYTDNKKELQDDIDKLLQVIDTKDVSLTEEQQARMNALLAKSNDILKRIKESNKKSRDIIDRYYDELGAITDDPESRMKIMDDWVFFEQEEKREQRQKEAGERRRQEIERKKTHELENEQVLESENTQRQVITN